MSSYLDGGDKQKRKQNKTGLKITFSLVGFGLVNFNGLVLGRRMVWSSLLCLNLAWSRRMGQTEKNKYGTVQELRSTFSHTKSIYSDFSLV